MTAPTELYRHSLSLVTDLYQLTMAAGYWQHGLAEREAVFYLSFRKLPFASGFAISCGLLPLVQWLESFRFTSDDLEYLRSLTGNDAQQLFDEKFLEYLADLRFTCDVDAVVEGTVVFPREPLLRIQGPLLQAQLVETALLTIMNFQTLVATKSARICHAAQGDRVMEFGLRRAQGIDGGISASRSAYVGGCHATSNMLAGKLFGIPVSGTHSHSWVLSFAEEQQAFEAYAETMPNNCVLLVDTFDSLTGVKRAITIAAKMKEAGRQLVGIRLDSGDLVSLSCQARTLLDEAGLSEVAIIASNDLDEYAIVSLKEAGAAISVWGVGTRLATAYDQPALGGIYKLSALRDADGEWQNLIKRSDDPQKATDPGILQVRRYYQQASMMADVVYDVRYGPDRLETSCSIETGKQVETRSTDHTEDLLVPVLRNGQRVYEFPNLSVTRQRTGDQLAMLGDEVVRLQDPVAYPIRMESRLYQERLELLAKAGSPAP
jgi:nicotinate phosphoribosyltransferase